MSLGILNTLMNRLSDILAARKTFGKPSLAALSSDSVFIVLAVSGWMLFLSPLFSAEVQWPLKNARLVDTHWHSWSQSFLLLENGRTVSIVTRKENTFFRRPVFDFPEEPSLLRHFPLEGGDLVTAIFNKEKKISFVAFNSEGKIIYRRNYTVLSEILAFDVRLGTDGQPICLFYTMQGPNHSLKIFRDGKHSDFMISDTPFDTIFLHLSENAAHAVTRQGAKSVWVTSASGVVTVRDLPHLITRPRFFSWKGTIYLVGIDTRNTIYRFSLRDNERLYAEKILSDNRLLFVDAITPFMLNKQLVLMLPSLSTRVVLRQTYTEFDTLQLEGRITHRSFLNAAKLQPIVYDETKLGLLTQTELGHIYFEPWEGDSTGLADFDWKVDGRKNPPVLSIFWKAARNDLIYRYAFDRKNDTEPLPEDKALRGKKVEFTNLVDGDYVMHVQARDSKGVEVSPVFHIPVSWRYRPEQPEVIVLNEVSPSMIRSGNLDFYVKNPFPADYFAEISTIPEQLPVKPLNLAKDGRASLVAKLKPGSYYLHIRCRDKRSGEFSSTLHHLFFVDSYNPDNDPSLSESTRELNEIDYIMQQIRKNKDNLYELKRWTAELQKRRFPEQR